jgi:TolA-binding protein
MARGDFETAKDEFLNTLNTAQDEYGAEAKYRLAEIFYQQKEYKQMYETLVSLKIDFASYDNWVGKAFLLLSDYFIAVNDPFNAKATLQSLIDDFPLEPVKEEARRKLKEIDDAEIQKKYEVEADTVDNEQ